MSSIYFFKVHNYHCIVIFCQVNSNGVLSYGSSFSDSSPESFPLDAEQNSALIALYWHDHNVNFGGQIFYRFSDEASFLNEVGANISAVFKVAFSPTILFIAT